MERYRDYRQALADGYVVMRPDVEQAQYHFTNDENGKEAEVRFDPTKPTSLLYRRTPHQMYKLEGVMYTARVHETEEELDRRDSAEHRALAPAHEFLRGAPRPTQ